MGHAAPGDVDVGRDGLVVGEEGGARLFDEAKGAV
jgi:hypothetical protein